MMTAGTEILFGAWRKSSYSSAGDNCVEMALADGQRVVGVRDSQHTEQVTLVLNPRAWVALCRAAVAESWR